ncbi:acetoacetate decarboxylase family protein [Nocardia takedensis]
MLDSIIRRLTAGLGFAPRATTPTASTTPGATYDGIPRMPAVFGRQPGPRQQPHRPGRYPADRGRALATWVAVRVDPDQLTALLPTGFTLLDPLLITEVVSLSELPWLAGRGYEMAILSVPVHYTAPAGTRHRGRLALVVFEDCPDAIISGRDELGWSKVYADTMTRTTDGATTTYTIAWGGTEILRLHADLTTPLPNLASWRAGPLMHYRVLPRTGIWGHLEVEQVTASDARPGLLSMRSLRTGTGHMTFTTAGFDRLPTLAHITDTLAALRLGDTVDVGQARIAGWQDLHDMHILGDHSS